MTTATTMLVAFVLLIGLAGAGLLMQSGMATQRRTQARLALVSRTVRVAVAAPLSRRSERPNPLAGVLAVFGCDWRRRAVYPVRWWLVLLGSAIAGWVAARLAAGALGEMALLAWPAVTLALSRMLFRGWARSRQARLLTQLPDALNMIVRTVRVGIPVAEGIRLAAAEAQEPTGAEFRALADQVAIGARLDEAVLAMAERVGMAEYRFFATVVVLQSQTGGGLSEALEGLAEVVRRRVALRARGFALSSEARTSAKVLTGLPFAAGAAMMVVAPGYMDPLIDSDLGHRLLGLAVLSLTVGALVMRSMIQRVLT